MLETAAPRSRLAPSVMLKYLDIQEPRVELRIFHPNACRWLVHQEGVAGLADNRRRGPGHPPLGAGPDDFRWDCPLQRLARESSRRVDGAYRNSLAANPGGGFPQRRGHGGSRRGVLQRYAAYS